MGFALSTIHDPARRVLIAAVLLSLPCLTATGQVIDDFDNTNAWLLILADGVKGEIAVVDGTLRLDYDFTSGAGYCVAKRDVGLALDPNYRFAMKLRGTGPRNTLEFKLVDDSGDNVWWTVQRGIEFPSDWTNLSMRRRHFSFAWGTSGGEPLERIGSIEIAVTAVEGGKGSIWLDDLIYEQLPDIEPQPTEPHATTGEGTDLGMVASDGSITWAPEHAGVLTLTFDSLVEFSAIELDWAADAAPDVYRAEVSIDGEHFNPIMTVHNSDGGTDTLFTNETEARAVRLVVPSSGAQLDAIRFTPVEEITNANDYFALLASRATRGAYPLYFESLSPWTVIGLPEHPDEALVSATGAIEPTKRGYSLEPFVILDGRVLTWADAVVTQSLDSHSLPIPSIHWELDDLKLDITALATNAINGDHVLARYQITNTSNQPQSLTLALVARPFQVLPAAQMLNTIGGTAFAESIVIEQHQILIDDQVFAQPYTIADAVLAADAPSGSLVDRLADNSNRRQSRQQSNGQFPSGALLYDLRIDPGGSSSIVISLPMNPGVSHERIGNDFATALKRERARWESLLGRTEILVPDSAAQLRDTIHANLGYILINADGPGIQPGSRSYERSWIRDGAMTSAALIALGHADDARAFIEWYSDYQYPDGKVPCVVDARGPDPVDENDAPGEFLFAIRNSAEAGGEFDEPFARAMYPKVQAAVDYIESMRNTRLTPEFTQSQDPILRACVGLMPESISHEGYSAKPMHSYWDDFWIYRGLWDAAALAERLGETKDQHRFEQLAKDFGNSIRDSIPQATTIHNINYIPGCVELGDFDATSSSIAFYPTGVAGVLDAKQLEATFERAWNATHHRMTGGSWDGMTPYEVRTVGTFIRLGWIDRAHAYMDWLLERQSPAGWSQWGEIAYRESKPARFVGDMPHTWVGSGAILSILSMFAYEDADTIVLAAGVPMDWLEDTGPVGVRGLVTRFGTLGYTLTCKDGTLQLDIQQGIEPPDGYRFDISPYIKHHRFDSLIIKADSKRLQADQSGILKLPNSTSRVIVREQ